ncbi:unnamed protein product [Callosobruchus maculatus]|uniref:Uncharacterized protein n=1 Tax=Callosobruchus maculatus TaxID=64391 RepID=A0A653DX56_CALMS|nr:unnamed protein product [Callosobruchus maculatus]
MVIGNLEQWKIIGGVVASSCNVDALHHSVCPLGASARGFPRDDDVSAWAAAASSDVTEGGRPVPALLEGRRSGAAC